VTDWNELPEHVRDAVQAHIGPVARATALGRGQNNDVAIGLGRDGKSPVFLKGVHKVPHQLRFLRNEIAVSELAPHFAPAMLFHENLDDDWLIVGFEYIVGRHPTFAPGSAALESIAATVDELGEVPAHGLRVLQERWSNVGSWREVAERAPELIEGWDVDEMSRWSSLVSEWLEGDRLVHTDLHPWQFIISESGRMYVIDWGWASVGAPWVDTSLMVLRLIWAGHSPESAEQWARARPAWAGLDEKTITAFAVFTAGFWTYRAATRAIPGWDRMSRLARDYAAWRLRESD
jgi:aminoglycoside phosphotransferase (APT) family kinase protein